MHKIYQNVIKVGSVLLIFPLVLGSKWLGMALLLIFSLPVSSIPDIYPLDVSSIPHPHSHS